MAFRHSSEYLSYMASENYNGRFPGLVKNLAQELNHDARVAVTVASVVTGYVRTLFNLYLWKFYPLAQIISLTLQNIYRSGRPIPNINFRFPR